MAKANDIKKKLTDVEGLDNKSWSEGYISALADEGLITEGEYDELMTWLVENAKE